MPLGEECAEEHNGGSPAAEGVAASSQIPRGPCRVVLVLDVWHPDLSDEEVREWVQAISLTCCPHFLNTGSSWLKSTCHDSILALLKSRSCCVLTSGEDIFFHREGTDVCR